MFNLSLTPFSTMTAEINQANTKRPISNQQSFVNRLASPPNTSSEAQSGTRLTMGDGMDFRRLADLVIRSEPSLRVDQV